MAFCQRKNRAIRGSALTALHWRLQATANGSAAPTIPATQVAGRARKQHSIINEFCASKSRSVLARNIPATQVAGRAPVSTQLNLLNFASIVSVSPECSSAEKLASSRTFSIIVCKRRAPIFSLRLFTSSARKLILSIASSLNSIFKPSVSKSAVYCFVRAFFGSSKIRLNSFFVRLSSSTRRGKRPCNSGIKSLGALMLKAPAAINKI